MARSWAYWAVDFFLFGSVLAVIRAGQVMGLLGWGFAVGAVCPQNIARSLTPLG